LTEIEAIFYIVLIFHREPAVTPFSGVKRRRTVDLFYVEADWL